MTKKRVVIVAVKGTTQTNLKDLITDLTILPILYFPNNVITGMVHLGFLLRTLEIPIDYLIDKIKDDYHIIFTGHSLGAAVAALVAIRLLCNENIFSSDTFRSKISFIGFGSPAIGDEIFKNSVDRHFKKNFHFYVNNDDIVVDILMCMGSGKISIPKDFDKITKKMYRSLNVFDQASLHQSDLDKLRAVISDQKEPFERFWDSYYQHFGTFIYMKDDGTYEIRDYKKTFNDLILLICYKSLSDHSMANYISTIIEIYQTENLQIEKKNIIKVDKLDDLLLPMDEIQKREHKVCSEGVCNSYCNKYSVKILNLLDKIIFMDVNICCKNADYITRTHLTLTEEDTILKRIYPITTIRNTRNSILLKFCIIKDAVLKIEVQNYFLVETKSEKLKLSRAFLHILTHFEETVLNLQLLDSDLENKSSSFSLTFETTLFSSKAISSTASSNKKYEIKQISIRNATASKQINLILTTDAEKYKAENLINMHIVDSLDEFYGRIKGFFDNPKPKLSSNLNGYIEIKKFEKLFEIEASEFIVD